MQFIYRLSPERHGGKPRPGWFSKDLCLRNFLLVFGRKCQGSGEFLLLADRCDERSVTRIWQEAANHSFVTREPLRLDHGQGGPSFLAALQAAIQSSPRDGLVYLVEDDYLHRQDSAQVLREGLELFDYVTLYDHPDKYAEDSPNEFVDNGTELASCLTGTVYLSKTCHWKETNSTTMTFACRLETLRQDAGVFRRHSATSVIPRSFKTFRELCTRRENKRRIGSPIPSYSTHCESRWLAPLVDWANIARWAGQTPGGRDNLERIGA